jgi:plastocyanin
MARRNLIAGGAAAAALALMLVACGGSSNPAPSPSPTPAPSPSPTPSPTPSPAPAPGGNTTFTITASGVSPKTLTVSAGTRVTFVNNDSRAHDVASDPHPIHTDCPPINDVGFLQPGQSRQTGNMNTVRTCGFHDHNQPDATALQGTIVIQ